MWGMRERYNSQGRTHANGKAVTELTRGHKSDTAAEIRRVIVPYGIRFTHSPNQLLSFRPLAPCRRTARRPTWGSACRIGACILLTISNQDAEGHRGVQLFNERAA